MDIEKGAIFSANRLYRYKLWRIWDSGRPLAMFVGLNPSTADETCDDPTVAKCIRYAQAWNLGGMLMTNLFAFRSTDRSALKKVTDPVGQENDRHLMEMSRSAGIIIAAWGDDGLHLGRSDEVRKLLPNLHYLKLNKSGEPTHPLYLSSDLTPTPWRY